MQCACAVLSSVVCLALQYFSTLSHKRYNLKKVTEHEICVLVFLYNFCLKHFSFWEEMNKMWLKMYIGLRVKYPLFLSNFNETGICETDFRKILRYKISWKIHPVGAELSFADGQTDGQTDMMKSLFTTLRMNIKMIFP